MSDRGLRLVRWVAGIVLVAMMSFQAMAQQPAAEAGIDAEDDTAGAVEPEQPRFDILEYQVEGNSTLPTVDVERAVYPHLGYKKTIADVNKAKEALEQAYRAAGYLTVSVDIPEQRVDQGVVKLRVVEGDVERLKITGSRYYSLGEIRKRVPSIAEGEVPYFPQVQAELGKLNRSQDRTVTPVLRPGQTPGKVEVELKVADKSPLHGGIELNNRATPNTEELRLLGYLRYDNLFQRDHSLAVQYQIAPENYNQVRVLSATYLLPWPNSQNLVAIYAVRSRSSIAAVGDIRVVGDANIYGVRVIRPMRGTDTFNHYFTMGVDYKDFGEAINLVGADTVNNPISYAPLTVGYNANAIGKKGITRYSVLASTALRGWFGNRDSEFQNRRSNANSNYLYVRGEISREQNAWAKSVFVTKFGGQISSQPLVSTEQFFAGGLDTVRGYLEAERAGDNALYGSLEWRTPPLLKPGQYKVDEFFSFGFYDAASVRIRDPLPSQTESFLLRSAGVGMRLKAYKTLTAAWSLGYPFDNGFLTRQHDPRFNFRLAYDF